MDVGGGFCSSGVEDDGGVTGVLGGVALGVRLPLRSSCGGACLKISVRLGGGLRPRVRLTVRPIELSRLEIIPTGALSSACWRSRLRYSALAWYSESKWCLLATKFSIPLLVTLKRAPSQSTTFPWSGWRIWPDDNVH